MNLFSYSPSQIVRLGLFRLNGRVVHLAPRGTPKGYVLISYTTVPFTLLSDDQFSGHTNYWESCEMTRAFLERGYAVDVIDKNNTTFTPKKLYTYFIDIEANLERLSPLLNPDCVKIFHATGAYWEFQNNAEAERINDVAERRGIHVAPRRISKQYSINSADMILSLCGTFPESTYAFLNKPIYHIPLSTTHIYPAPQKDWDAVKKNFIWFGGAGAVHKGLDLVLEAFAAMPEYSLTVCGKFNEQDFLDAYKKELFETTNIKSVGRIDPGSELFEKIRNESIGIVFPSCSEGCASSVVICMHAGLIPVVSRESGIETGNFGITLEENSIESIKEAVRKIASEPAPELENRSLEAWKAANANHTRERFAKAFRGFIDSLQESHA